MSNKETKQTLIQRIRNKMDQASWEEFNATYSAYIKAILCRSGIPYNLVDDLCQDILVKIWKNIENFEYNPDTCRFRTWLSTVCRNTIYNYFECKKATMVNIEDTKVAAKGAEIDDIIELEWKIYIAGKAMERVTQTFNDKALSAYKMFQTGKQAPEIAVELGISESSVYVYSKRVKDAISREIILLVNDLA